MPSGYNTDQLTPVTLFDASGVAVPQDENVSVASYMTLTAAGVGTTTGTDIANLRYSKLLVFINITAITGTVPTLTVTIRSKDPASAVAYDLLVSVGLAATGLTVLEVGPGITIAANAAVARAVPTAWHAIAVVGGTTPAVTGTISYRMMQ